MSNSPPYKDRTTAIDVEIEPITVVFVFRPLSEFSAHSNLLQHRNATHHPIPGSYLNSIEDISSLPPNEPVQHVMASLVPSAGEGGEATTMGAATSLRTPADHRTHSPAAPFLFDKPRNFPCAAQSSGTNKPSKRVREAETLSSSRRDVRKDFDEAYKTKVRIVESAYLEKANEKVRSSFIPHYAPLINNTQLQSLRIQLSETRGFYNQAVLANEVLQTQISELTASLEAVSLVPPDAPHH